MGASFPFLLPHEMANTAKHATAVMVSVFFIVFIRLLVNNTENNTPFFVLFANVCFIRSLFCTFTM